MKFFFIILILSLILASFKSIEIALPWLLLMLALIGFREIKEKRIFYEFTLSPIMAFYVVWLFVVLQFSLVPSNSLMQLLVIINLPLTYLIATNFRSFSDAWKVLSIAIFLICILFSIQAIWQVYTHVDKGYANGPLLDRNAFAALINLVWFPALYLFVTKRYSAMLWHIPIGLGVFINSTALFATTSRAGIAIWILLLPIALWAIYKNTQSKRTPLKILVISAIAFIVSSTFLDASIANRTFDLMQDTSTDARLMLWKSSINMVAEHPLVGSGWGTWSNFYQAYRLQNENASAGLYAHNDYLQLASDGGLIAFLILAGLLLSVLLLLKRSLIYVGNDNGLESVTLLIGVLAIFIHAAANFIFYLSFMNIVAGLYLARAANLTDTPEIKNVPKMEQIKRPIKRLFISVLLLAVITPYLLHQLAILSFYDKQLGLKAVNLIAPTVTAQDIARVIVAIRPQNDLAQDALVQTNIHFLENSRELGLDETSKRELLNEAILRLDVMRFYSANRPSLGVREVDLLMTYRSLIGEKNAYKKVREILRANFKANPRDAKSIIALSRLQLAERQPYLAQATLIKLGKYLISHRDQQLIKIESIRQYVAPRLSSELDSLESELHEVVEDDEPIGFYEKMDTKLKEIEKQI